MNGIQQAYRAIARWPTKTILLALLPLTSCSVFRPAPTHGGGKRFDEEQRLVSAAISKTTSRMNFSRIPRSKVSLEVTAMNTSGGLQDLYSGSTDKARTPVTAIHTGIQNLFGYRASPWLQSNSTLTNQDVYYLEESVKAQLRARKFQVVSPTESDVHLIVLVDCLGTNMSRQDVTLAFRDDLKATCAITWYAVDSRSQEVLSKAENLSSSGTLNEWNVRLSPGSWNNHSLSDLPTDPLYSQDIHPIAKGNRSASPVAALLMKPKSSPTKRSGLPPLDRIPNPDFTPLPPEPLDDLDPSVLPPLDPTPPSPAAQPNPDHPTPPK